MAEEQNNGQTSSGLEFGQHMAQNAAKAAGAVKSVVQAAAKAGVGDVAGAAITLLKDGTVVRAIIAIILVLAFLVLGCAMLIGSAITGTVEYIGSGLAENWEEAWEEQGIRSNGNLLYLYSEEALDTASAQAVYGFMIDAFTDLLEGADDDPEDGLMTNTDEVQENHDDRTAVSDNEYRVFLQSITDEEALAGDSGALRKCLNMIKGRVAQRGEQLESYATPGYVAEATAESIGAIFQNAIQYDPILYFGLGESSISIDTTAFQWTDIQALKILAAYSIQHDCQLTEIDMWDLMDYCGWYDGSTGELPSASLDEDESIYNTSADAKYEGEDIESGETTYVESGTVLNTTDISLSAPSVPVWRGNFAPQWYKEELAALMENNKRYDQLEAKGTEQATATLETMVKYATDSEGNIDPSNFSYLSTFEPYGIIDRIYTSTEASLTVTRTAYETALSTHVAEATAKFVDGILALVWDEAAEKIGAKEAATSLGVVQRLENGTHTFTLTDTEAGKNYYLTYEGSDESFGWKYCNTTGESISWTGLEADTTYNVYEYYEVTTAVEPEEAESEEEESTHPTLPPEIEDLLPPGLEDFITYSEDTGESTVAVAAEDETTETETETEYVTTVYNNLIETFTTFVEQKDYQAYKLNLSLNVTYTAVSVDYLLNHIMGLWPGSLYARETDEDTGIQYAEGQVGNELLQYQWEDTYTDPDTGEVTTLEFTRSQAHQAEAYEDIVLAIADILGISTAGLFGNTSGNGKSIVQVAKQECDYYHANIPEGSGGMRYWEMAADAGGNSSINYNAPWCACFVLCCAWQCGYIGEGGAWGNFGGGDWTFTCSGLYNYLLNNGYANGYTTSDYTPVPGDLIFFNETVSTSGMEHIGIVVSVDSSTGVVTYIDGNSGGGKGTLPEAPNYHQASNYSVGTVAYSETLICAYANPFYPVISEPLYLSVTGSVQPNVQATYVTLNSQSVLLAGEGRLRESQLVTALNELKDNYPALYTEALATNLTVDASGTITGISNKSGLVTEWNNIADEKAEAFAYAQGEIRDKLVAKPIVTSVKAENGFDWLKSEFRENLLLGIITTSDKTDALVDVLVELTSGMSNNITDETFLEKMAATEEGESFLHRTIEAHKDDLWPSENSAFHNAWIKSIDDLLKMMIDLYADISSIGDPNASVEEQVFYYLTNSMGLPISSACGVLANIEAESSFNPNCVGDSGTSYGLCQWHNERYDALIDYCTSNGLDYTTVVGQMKYLQYELESNYASMLSQLRAKENTAQGAYDAAYLWCTQFERPANMETKGQQRGNTAKSTYWPRYSTTVVG